MKDLSKLTKRIGDCSDFHSELIICHPEFISGSDSLNINLNQKLKQVQLDNAYIKLFLVKSSFSSSPMSERFIIQTTFLF